MNVFLFVESMTVSTEDLMDVTLVGGSTESITAAAMRRVRRVIPDRADTSLMVHHRVDWEPTVDIVEAFDRRQHRGVHLRALLATSRVVLQTQRRLVVAGDLQVNAPQRCSSRHHEAGLSRHSWFHSRNGETAIGRRGSFLGLATILIHRIRRFGLHPMISLRSLRCLQITNIAQIAVRLRSRSQ